MRFIDLTGRRLGRLVVLARAPNRNGSIAFHCRCDCGTEITAMSANLRKGHTQSCGCLCIDRTREANRKHGLAKTRDYLAWGKMIQRCTNPADPSYPRYGARGITVCDRWRDFANFIEDMGKAPPGFTIERINNDGNYEPQNCKWASRQEQANNRRSNRLVTHNGITRTLSEWARAIGVKRSTLGMRINTYGWSVERALGGQIG